MQLTPLRGWQAVLLMVGGLIALALLAAILFWVAIAFFVVGSAAVLHLWYLPRLAGNLRVSPWVVLGIAGLVLAGLGWWIGQETGLAIMAAAWVALFAAPQVLLNRLKSGVRIVSIRTTTTPTRRETPGDAALVGTKCTRCGVVSFGGGACPHCGAALPAPTR